MALSSYSHNTNWATPPPPQMGAPTTLLESLKEELIDNNAFFNAETECLDFFNFAEFECQGNLSNAFTDPLFNPNEFFCTHEYNSNFDLGYTNDDRLFTELIPTSPRQFDPYPLQKRPKVSEFTNNSIFSPSFFNEYAPVATLPMEQNQAPEIANFGMNLWLPEQIQVPGEVSYGGNLSERKNVSAQSVAARERRRKITEKTQELGKLVPGGTKMNTAEMFQSAFKYVKYLQASVSILQSMDSFQENNQQTSNTEELQALLQSTIVQEKLYSEEKCLVPTMFVKVLAAQHDNESDCSICRDLIQLIESENI